MKRTIVIVFLICIIIAWPYGAYSQEWNSAMTDLDYDGLLSNEHIERERTLQALIIGQLNARKSLTGVLEEASRTSLKDTSYMSSLHCAIQTIEFWRIYEAEDALFLINDYELDRQSVPDGFSVSVSFFYPVARALVSLRVEPRKVMDAIVSDEANERQIRVLTWVLAQRTGSTESAITFIERIIESEGANPNIMRSFNLLGTVEHRDDLLISQIPGPASTIYE